VALYDLGVAALREGRPEGAASYWRQVLAGGSGFLPARRALATLLVQQGRAAEGIALWEEVVRAEPRNAEARSYLAQALLLSGEFERARQAAREAAELDADDPRSAVVELLASARRDDELGVVRSLRRAARIRGFVPRALAACRDILDPEELKRWSERLKDRTAARVLALLLDELMRAP
ncbi:MAG: tetratricopeptide repeat protein, partial [Clostridia bacterium]|nr:tetratricopeptide repeat protein [Clostridia bacterium]